MKGGLKVSLGSLEWYINSYGTDFDNSEIVICNLSSLTAAQSQAALVGLGAQRLAATVVSCNAAAAAAQRLPQPGLSPC